MKLLFQIAFKHSYYRDGNLDKSQLRADHHTAGLLKRLDIIMRRQQGAFYFFCPEHAGPKDLIEYLLLLLDGRPLTFSLVQDATEFAWITDLPLNWCGQFLLSSKNIERELRDTRVICQTPLDERVDYSNNAIAVVQIYPEDLLLGGARNVQYLVDFQARQTCWEYYLFNRSRVKLNAPFVSNSHGIVFNGPREVTMNNGEKALSFNSGKKMFSIQQIPLYVFNLVDRLDAPVAADGQLNEIDIIRGLPTPAMNHLISRTIDNEEQIVSEMYVYL